tara:strand:+ start:25578 stop:25898 length:321 start_codon:yes stop_codon:yes gene_type:complete
VVALVRLALRRAELHAGVFPGRFAARQSVLRRPTLHEIVKQAFLCFPPPPVARQHRRNASRVARMNDHQIVTAGLERRLVVVRQGRIIALTFAQRILTVCLFDAPL